MSNTVTKLIETFTRDRASVDVIFDRAGKGKASKALTLVFEGGGRKRWRDLVAEHHRTGAQHVALRRSSAQLVER